MSGGTERYLQALMRRERRGLAERVGRDSGQRWDWWQEGDGTGRSREAPRVGAVGADAR